MTHFSPPNGGSVFSTRDMDISLATSTSATMQYGNPLTQLAAEVVTPKPRLTEPFAPSSSRASAHQKSQSLQLNLGIGDAHSEGRMLGSPFEPVSMSRQRSTHDSTLETPVATASRLASPLRMPPPISRSSSFKRRNQDDGMGGLGSAEGPSPFPDFDTSRGPRRVRARGFSLGDVSESSRRLSNLFAPPTQAESSEPLPVFPTSIAGSATLLPAPNERIKRLGSPFTEKPSRPLFNTFPRNFSLHGLEPAIESAEERQGSLDAVFPGAFGKQV
jgi:hypothetical protein